MAHAQNQLQLGWVVIVDLLGASFETQFKVLLSKFKGFIELSLKFVLISLHMSVSVANCLSHYEVGVANDCQHLYQRLVVISLVQDLIKSKLLNTLEQRDLLTDEVVRVLSYCQFQLESLRCFYLVDCFFD